MNLAKVFQKLPKPIRAKTINLYRYLPSSKKTVIKEIDGVKYELDLSRLVHAQMYHYGVWEPNTTNIIKKYVKKGMTVFDIGASSGVHGLRMANQVKKDGMVYAFEPSDWMYDYFERNLFLNRDIVHWHNVILEKIALTNFDGTDFFESTEHGKIGRAIDEPKIQTQFMTMDSYVERGMIKKLDFIKIDTDGFEAKIFEGGEKTLRKFKPVMIVEFRPSLTKEIINVLKPIGYHFYKEDTEEEYQSEAELIKDIEGEVKNVLCKTPN